MLKFIQSLAVKLWVRGYPSYFLVVISLLLFQEKHYQEYIVNMTHHTRLKFRNRETLLLIYRCIHSTSLCFKNLQLIYFKYLQTTSHPIFFFHFINNIFEYPYHSTTQIMWKNYILQEDFSETDFTSIIMGSATTIAYQRIFQSIFDLILELTRSPIGMVISCYIYLGVYTIYICYL